MHTDVLIDLGIDTEKKRKRREYWRNISQE